MKTLEEILAETIIKYESDMTKEEALEAIREPKEEYQEQWIKPALEAMAESVNAKLQEAEEEIEQNKVNVPYKEKDYDDGLERAKYLISSLQIKKQ